jgi:hypothetical protein
LARGALCDRSSRPNGATQEGNVSEKAWQDAWHREPQDGERTAITWRSPAGRVVRDTAVWFALRGAWYHASTGERVDVSTWLFVESDA